jgi:predicted GNAT superfamily acetyltransferase
LRRKASPATQLYADLQAEAVSRGIPRLVCEIHIDPPNLVSLRFHQKQGFAEVGQQSVEDPHTGSGKKIVSLQIKELER